MVFSNPIDDSGLSQEITRITGANPTVYSNKARIARLNAALDRYWSVATETANEGTFDDTNRTGLPVETQNIVSGTNNYKISSFTNKVLQLLKMAVLDDSAVEHDLVREEFDDLEDFKQLYTTSTTGTPSHWTKMGDYIYLRPSPNFSETGGLRAYVNRELSKYDFVSFTVTQATPAVFSATGHGLVAGDAIILETDGTLLTGLTADTVVYYVIAAGLTTGAFEVSTTIGGTAVNTTSTQTGNHKFIKVSKEPGIPVVHHNYLARYASLPYLIEKMLPIKNDISALIQVDERDIKKYWATTDKEITNRMINEPINYL
jgi:hypothetical protein